jgi:hypothetical protein
MTFSWNETARHTADIYRDLLAHRKREGGPPPILLDRNHESSPDRKVLSSSSRWNGNPSRAALSVAQERSGS